MQRRGGRAHVDETVQLLPAPARAAGSSPCVEVTASGTSRTNATIPAVMNRRLATSGEDVPERQPLIQHDVDRQVERRVEEGEQPEHPPEPDHRFQPVSRRSGVMASDRSRNRNAQMPVVSSSSSTGLTPERVVDGAPRQPSRPARARAGTRRLSECGRTSIGSRSEVLPEIHAGVERRDLVAVAVEHQRRPAAEESGRRRSRAWLQRG